MACRFCYKVEEKVSTVGGPGIRSKKKRTGRERES
jgi:hypothetical protein